MLWQIQSLGCEPDDWTPQWLGRLGIVGGSNLDLKDVWTVFQLIELLFCQISLFKVLNVISYSVVKESSNFQVWKSGLSHTLPYSLGKTFRFSLLKSVLSSDQFGLIERFVMMEIMEMICFCILNMISTSACGQ